MVMAPTKERTLGQKIKRARLRKGLSQAQLADELGVSIYTVRTWEQGLHVPVVSMWRALWAQLGLTADDFGVDTDPPPDGGYPFVARPSGSDVGVDAVGAGSRAEPSSWSKHTVEATTWPEFAAILVNSIESQLSLSLRRDMERAFTDGLYAMDGQDPEMAATFRRLFTGPEHRTAHFVAAAAMAFMSYVSHRYEPTATADLENNLRETAGIDLRRCA